MDRKAAFYSQPSYVGAGFPVFSGARRQRGGNLFGALRRDVLPTLKTVGVKALGHVAKKALGVGKNVFMDVMKGVNPKQSLMTHGKQAVKEMFRDGTSYVLNSAVGKRKSAKASRKRRAPNGNVTPATKRRTVSTPANKRRSVSIAQAKKQRIASKKKKTANF